MASEAKESRRLASPGQSPPGSHPVLYQSPWPDYDAEYPCFPDLETQAPEIIRLVNSRTGSRTGCLPNYTEAASPGSISIFRLFLMHDHWLDLILNNKLLLKRRLPQRLSRPLGLFGWRVYWKLSGAYGARTLGRAFSQTFHIRCGCSYSHFTVGGWRGQGNFSQWLCKR